MSTSSQTPAFRIKAIKVKSPDPRSVLALLPPEIKKPKIRFKPVVPKVAEVVLPVAQESAPHTTVEQKLESVSSEAVPVQQMPVVMEATKYLPDPNSTLAILPVEEDEIEIERFEAANKGAETKTFVQENIAGLSEFAVVPVQETSLVEMQTPETETEVEAPEAIAMEMATTEEISSLPVIGKPNVFDVASKIGRWITGHVKIQANRKRLRVSESVSLGEKRFIAVVQLDGKEFLVGGAPNSLSLLANVEKNGNTSFAEVLSESYEQGRNQG